jgi:hypothetical protein
MGQVLIGTLLLGGWLLNMPSSWLRCDAAEPQKPAKPAAAPVLDLSRLPRLPNAEAPATATVANLTYTAGGKVPAAIEFHQKELLKQGWKELPGGYSSPEYASATLQKAGHKLSMMVFPLGEQVQITLLQHGNVVLKELPVPADAKVFVETPVSLMYLTTASKESTTEACRKLLMAKGWTPYGEAGDSRYYLKDLIRLGVTVSVAPAQDNKTVIDLQSLLLSVALPAPPEVKNLQYDDGQLTLRFDAQQSPEDLAAFYRERLGAAGWEATTESLISDDNRRTLIFRNATKEYAELEVLVYEEANQVKVSYQTAAMFAAEEARAKAAIAAANKPKPMPAKKTVKLTLPAGAKEVMAEGADVEFKLGSGKASKVVQAWRDDYVKAGWKATVEEFAKEAGALVLEQGDLRLAIDYLDPGFIPAQVSASLSGGDLEVIEPKTK